MTNWKLDNSNKLLHCAYFMIHEYVLIFNELIKEIFNILFNVLIFNEFPRKLNEELRGCYLVIIVYDT